MHKKLAYLLFACLGAALMTSPASARSREEKSDFRLSPLSAPAVEFYDEGLLEAAEIAKLKARKHSRKRCWRAVKQALLDANVVPYRPTSRYARDAGVELETEFAFKKLEIDDPYEAPIGSLLVYGGPGAGHIEFRVEEGFVSDFANPRPSQRPLIGVYVSSAAVAREPYFRSLQ